jgi:hypothetical protein
MENQNRPEVLLEERDLSPAQRHSRRHLMKLAALGGISLAGMRLFAGKSGSIFAATPSNSPALTGGPTDGATQFSGVPGSTINEQVLNFALTLEILESDLYRQALNLASGLPLDNALNVNPNVYSLKVSGGGLNAALTQSGYLYLKQFAYVEGAHRDFLEAAITAAGFAPAPKNLGGYTFPTMPQANIKSILTQILPLEETGVRAYLGALPYLTDLGLAQTAGSIYSTECRHSAVLNVTLGNDPGPAKRSGDYTAVPNPVGTDTYEYYLPPSTVLKAASAYFVA